jgi:uncharacterized protein (TIGR03083 family)
MATELGARPGPVRRRVLDRDTAMTLAATEYDRVTTLFENLTADQWTRPTECPGWDVRAVAGHMLGMTQMIATIPSLVRQQAAAHRTAKRTGALMIDVLTAAQVTRNAGLSTLELVGAMRDTTPKAVRRRRRIPGFIRARTMPDPKPFEHAAEQWTFDFLFDIILTRDPFMHRLDISRATGVPAQTTAEHEGVIVDDVVREWAARHGQPYTLILSGPAGGTWQRGDGEHLAMDALDFCRALSGRGNATGLLSHQVPF